MSSSRYFELEHKGILGKEIMADLCGVLHNKLQKPVPATSALIAPLGEQNLGSLGRQSFRSCYQIIDSNSEN